MNMQITKPQLGRLQTLFSQFSHHEIGVGTSREERLGWASLRLRKPVSSFSDLTADDAGWLIDQIQTQLGVKAPAKPRKRLDRDQARRAGIDGRHDGQEFSSAPEMASSADLATIESYYARLGWERAQFDAWMRSSRSPLKHKAAPSIATVADANRVRWALKGMLQHAGKWEDRGSQRQVSADGVKDRRPA
jgi:hypothetical protein